MSDFTDLELAAFIEGALPSGRAGELKERLATDDALRRRLDELAAVDFGMLRGEDVPAGLLEATVARLEADGLIVDEPPLPETTYRNTLERLEREGLVASGRGPIWRRAAAVLLLGIALGVVVGYLTRGDRVVRDVVEVEVPVERVIERPVDRIVERTVEVPGPPVLVDREVPVWIPIDREVVKEVVVEKKVPVEVVRTVEVQVPVLARIPVSAARSAEVWDSETDAWRSLEGGSDLFLGSVIRGIDARAQVTVDGRRYRLGGSPHVLSPRGLEPLPFEAAVASSRRRTIDPEALGRTGTSALIDQWGAGSSSERALVQRELERRWSEHGAAAGLAALVSSSDRPPVTADGWRSWWRAVR